MISNVESWNVQIKRLIKTKERMGGFFVCLFFFLNIEFREEFFNFFFIFGFLLAAVVVAVDIFLFVVVVHNFVVVDVVYEIYHN